MRATLSKQERLCSVSDINTLITRGHYIVKGPIRCCYLIQQIPDDEQGEEILDMHYNQILVSVPKKVFKRAVKRNLLKRRLRHAYRVQKNLLPQGDVDMMFFYTAKEILPYAEIAQAVREILIAIAGKLK